MAVGKILVVGYGSVGRRHTENLLQLGCDDLVFLRSGRPDVIDQVPPPGQQVRDLSEALAQDIVAAVIATPSAMHLDTALPLAKQGCHLFIEKPVSDDREIDRCQRLLKIAQEQNLVTMVGYQFRFHPLLVELREGIRNGRIGAAEKAHAQWGEYLPDWHPWEDHRAGYAARKDLGGGVMLTLIHPVDYLYWLFGETNDVQAEYGKLEELQTWVPDDWAKLKLQVVFSPQPMGENYSVGPYSRGVTDEEGRFTLVSRYDDNGAFIGKHSVAFEYSDIGEDAMSNLRVAMSDAKDAGDGAEFDKAKKKIAEMKKKLKGRPILGGFKPVFVDVPSGGLEDYQMDLKDYKRGEEE